MRNQERGELQKGKAREVNIIRPLIQTCDQKWWHARADDELSTLFKGIDRVGSACPSGFLQSCELFPSWRPYTLLLLSGSCSCIFYITLLCFLHHIAEVYMTNQTLIELENDPYLALTMSAASYNELSEAENKFAMMKAFTVCEKTSSFRKTVQEAFSTTRNPHAITNFCTVSAALDFSP